MVRKYNNTNTCLECGNPAIKTFDGENYCKECLYAGSKDIEAYINKYNIRIMRSAVDNHIIVNNANKRLIEFCLDYNIHWWFDANDHKCIHIDVKDLLQSEKDIKNKGGI